MDLTSFFTLAATGLAVAFIHAAIPTHWLPFVVVARAQGWSRGRALAMVTLCSGGHLVMMTSLGLALAWFGLQIDERWSAYFPYVAGGALVAVGLLILFRHWRGWTHGHGEWIEGHCQHDHGHEHHHDPVKPVARTSDWAAVGGLFAMLTFSPCEGLLPVYLSGVQFGWGGVTLLSVVLAAGTWGAMLIFTWLTLLGVERVRFKWLEKCEAPVLGTLLVVCGLALIVIEHLHDHA
jgi:nickel/cobalt transporter (NicO) family protein